SSTGTSDDRFRCGIALTNQQPVVLAASIAWLHPHERPPSTQPPPREIEFQMAVSQSLPRVADRPPCAAIPDIDMSGAVLTGWNVAFESRVIERVILDFDRKPPGADVFARTFRNRPAFQHAIELEPKIEMQLASLVPLNHELRLRAATPHAALRLGCDLEIPFAAVCRKGCLHDRCRNCRRSCEGAGPPPLSDMSLNPG